MYNLSNHYENIFHHLQTIITDPQVIYLHPFGSTQPENLEFRRDDTDPPDRRYPPMPRGPVFIFYDQEPLDLAYNRPVFDAVINSTRKPFVLVSTEKHSAEAELICKEYPFVHINYFFHIFAAHDWFRGHEFLSGLQHPQQRKIEKTYISFNRLTSNRRIYRSLLVNELYKNNLLKDGHVSYSHHCPDDGAFDENLRRGVPEYKFDSAYIEEAIANIKQIPELRIDFVGQDIPNQSMLLSPMPALMKSFVFLVTETCYFQNKTHLTEKIFKPIVLRMPFILAGCAYNLEYLRSYGFRTFGDYWDESYDTIEDPIKRLEAIVQTIKTINQLTPDQQKSMLLDMLPILEHNYQLFNDPEFIKREWDQLMQSFHKINQCLQRIPPYRLDVRTGLPIPVQ
jgi:hypothetical protein